MASFFYTRPDPQGLRGGDSPIDGTRDPEQNRIPPRAGGTEGRATASDGAAAPTRAQLLAEREALLARLRAIEDQLAAPAMQDGGPGEATRIASTPAPAREA